MDGEHGDFPLRPWTRLERRTVVPAGRGKVEIADPRHITRVLLTTVIYPGNNDLAFEELPMNTSSAPAFIAFNGDYQIAAGDLPEVARAAKQALDRQRDISVLIFNGVTSHAVDLDFRGSVDDVLARLPVADSEPAAPPARGPGRPKLGVVAREITLLPRHWEWLARQPGGASVAIRKLVDDARKGNEDKDRVREAQDAAYRFMSAMAGNKPHFEEATRALFAPDPKRFKALIAEWPVDVRDHVARLAERVFHGLPPAKSS
jgi:hypothetical protein